MTAAGSLLAIHEIAGLDRDDIGNIPVISTRRRNPGDSSIDRTFSKNGGLGAAYFAASRVVPGNAADIISAVPGRPHALPTVFGEVTIKPLALSPRDCSRRLKKASPCFRPSNLTFVRRT